MRRAPALRPLLAALLRVFGAQWAALGALQVACVAAALAGPLVLSGLLAYLAAPSNTPAGAPAAGLAWAAAMAATQGCAALATAHFNFAALRLQLRVRAGLLAAAARAVHEAPLAFRARLTDGALANAVSVDAQKVTDTVPAFHQLWTLPLQVAAVLAMLNGGVGGGGAAAGVAVLAVVVPLNLAVSRAIGLLTRAMMAARDERVALTSELVVGIRPVKLLGWERAVCAAVGAARAREVAALASRKYLDAVCVFLWATTPTLMALATFGAVVLAAPAGGGGGAALNPSVVFATVAELNLLTFPLNALPWIYTGCLEAWVSLLRLEAVLCYPRGGGGAGGGGGGEGDEGDVVRLEGAWEHPAAPAPAGEGAAATTPDAAVASSIPPPDGDGGDAESRGPPAPAAAPAAPPPAARRPALAPRARRTRSAATNARSAASTGGAVICAGGSPSAVRRSAGARSSAASATAELCRTAAAQWPGPE